MAQQHAQTNSREPYKTVLSLHSETAINRVFSAGIFNFLMIRSATDIKHNAVIYVSSPMQ